MSSSSSDVLIPAIHSPECYVICSSMMPSCLRGTLLSFRAVLAVLYPHHGSWLDPKWRPLVRVACLHGTAKHSQYTETSWLSQRYFLSLLILSRGAHAAVTKKTMCMKRTYKNGVLSSFGEICFYNFGSIGC
mgnify:CR=1 FL=1